jgi:hypothetical protein
MKKRYSFRAFFAACMAMVMCASHVTATVEAAAVFDSTFFSTNSITFYDPRCADTSSAKLVQLAGKDSVEKILNFFMRKGLSLAQASGIIGNMMQESGLNPAIIQGGRIADDSYTLESGVGFGLVQWTSGGRQQNFMAFMKQLGVGVTNLNGQLEFVWKEMTESYPKTISALKSTQDPVEAAVAVHGPPTPGYEASADSPEKVRSVRGGNAKGVYDKYKDAPALAGSTADASMTPSGEGSDVDTAKQVASKTKNGISNTSCDGSGDNQAGSGDLAKTILAYAWPDYTAGKTDQQPAYSAAVKKARSEGRYISGANGDDCGGFVSTAMIDSGFEKNYNYGGKAGQGNTIAQEKWLKENWKPIGANDPKVLGDVAINEDHTYMYVGDISKDFHSKIASASLPDRAPMAGHESDHDPSFRWYRRK